jgi:hypothetical protein
MSATVINWEALREIPAGSRGSPRGYCESCRLYIWSDGGLKVPGVRGYYCTVVCLECQLFGSGKCRWCGDKLDSGAQKFCSESHRKQSNETRFGNGTRLLAFLARKQPGAYHRLTHRGDAFCLGCGDPLGDKRSGAQFCDDKCRKRYCGTSPTSPKTGINAETPL